MRNAFIRIYDKSNEGLYRIIFEPVLSLYIDKKGKRWGEITEIDIDMFFDCMNELNLKEIKKKLFRAIVLLSHVNLHSHYHSIDRKARLLI